jgi:hypothetical protein
VSTPFDTAACLASPASWTEANQRYLAAEFARLKAQLSGADAQVQSEGLRAARAALPAPAAIDQATELFRPERVRTRPAALVRGRRNGC